MNNLSLLNKFCFSSKYDALKGVLVNGINEIKSAGTYKNERRIFSQQQMKIISEGRKEVLNFCANNYLGLSNNKEVMKAAAKSIKHRGYGMSSVRFICGTQDIHKQLEKTISDFYGNEDTILYSSCFDANGGFFEAITNEKDAVISDALNHASIIDGIRLCKAERHRYDHLNTKMLEKILQKTQKNRFR